MIYGEWHARLPLGNQWRFIAVSGDHLLRASCGAWLPRMFQAWSVLIERHAERSPFQLRASLIASSLRGGEQMARVLQNGSMDAAGQQLPLARVATVPWAESFFPPLLFCLLLQRLLFPAACSANLAAELLAFPDIYVR